MLKFSKANAKTSKLANHPSLSKWLNGRKVYSLDILSGHTCPFALECYSKVVESNGKLSIKDGKHTRFRCFSASQEVLYTNLYKLRKHNTKQLMALRKSYKRMAQAIKDSMPRDIGICRIHVAGDFFNANYFLAWLEVSRNNPSVLFYAYTKSLGYWLSFRDEVPANLVLTASRGGRLDEMIDDHNLREAVVVFSEREAQDKGLPIDHDDSHAADPDSRDQSFALLLHGMQPANTEASKALRVLKGKGSYSRKKGK